jgi:hypothetical protein
MISSWNIVRIPAGEAQVFSQSVLQGYSVTFNHEKDNSFQDSPWTRSP